MLQKLEEIADAAQQPFGEGKPRVFTDVVDPNGVLFNLDQARQLFEDDGYRCGFLSPGHEFFSFVRGKALVPDAEYASLDDAQALLLAGTPAIFRALHTRSNTVWNASRQLANLVGVPVHANGYWTKPGQQCFPLHSDPDSVLAIQLAGAKKWLVFPPREQSPDDPGVATGWVELGDDSYPPAEDAAFVVTLQAGEALLVPRCWGHYALTTEGVESLHVSLGMLHKEIAQKTVNQQYPVHPGL